MSVKTLVAVSALLVAATAFAQNSLGTISSVQGLVTVTDGTTGGTTAAGAPITSGMRFVATSTGSAVLRLNNGCVVNLQPNQAVTVVRSMTCEALLAAVQMVGGATTASDGGSAATGALASAGLAVGGYGLSRITPNRSISSN